VVRSLQATLTVLAFTLLVCAAPADAQARLDGFLLPDKTDVESIERACSGSTTGLHSLKARVAAAVDDWLSTASQGSLPEAQVTLNRVFDPIRSAGGLSPQMSLYVSCMEKALRQLLDRPRPVNGVGTSRPLWAGGAASEQEMWSRGCQEAEQAAIAKLRVYCSERIFVPTITECTRGNGNPRAYTAQVTGECRIR